MPRSTAIAYTLADHSIPAADLPARMQLWWGTHDGALLGLLTDRVGPVPAGGDVEMFTRLGRAAALVKCLADERVWSVIGVTRPDLQAVSDELLDLPWQSTTITVDDEPVQAGTVRYRGLDAAVGNAAGPVPFVLARPAGDERPWPNLSAVLVPDDDA